MYKSTPITKKAKIAGEYNSALKQTLLDTNAQMLNDSSGFKSYDLKLGEKGKKGKKGKEKTRNKSWDDLRAEGWSEDKIKEAKDWRSKNQDAPRDQVGTGDFEPDEPDVPGTPDEITAFQTKRKTYKDNVGDLENREMNRVIKKAEKDVRRGEAKKARIENKKAKFENKLKKDEEGNIIAPKAGEKGYRKYKRLEAKGTETTRELSAFQDRAANAAEGQASGKGLDTRFRSTDVDETQGDFTRPEQIERLKMQKTYDASTQTDSQRFANEAAKLNKFKLTSADTSAGDSFINKFGVPMRAPMKKNYFKK